MPLTRNYEVRGQPLVGRHRFLLRLARHFAIATCLVFGSLLFGAVGYHWLEGRAWIDAVLDAAMLLGGMGPVHAPSSSAGKLFAAFYALYSGLLFLIVSGIMVAPVAHRILHRFHLDEPDFDQMSDPIPPADAAQRDAMR
jgi:hypothetical protein